MRANGTDPVPDQVKKACMISNTPEPLKTHLQLNVGKLGNFNALRVGDLKITWGVDASSGRLQPEARTTKNQWKLMQSPGKGTAKENPARGKKGWQERKRKPLRQRLRRNDNRTLTIRWVNVETVESMDTKQLIVGSSRRTNLKVKARARESRNPT